MEGPSQALPNGLKDIQAGDCVVAFSRQKLYQLKKAIELQTSNKVGSRQARRLRWLAPGSRHVCAAHVQQLAGSLGRVMPQSLGCTVAPAAGAQAASPAGWCARLVWNGSCTAALWLAPKVAAT